MTAGVIVNGDAVTVVRGDSGQYWATSGRRSIRAGAHRTGDYCVRCGSVVTLALMHDGKTSGGVFWDPRKGAVATVPNSFGLPAGPEDIGGSCPGATPACEGCYAAVLESAYTGLREMLAGNLRAVRHLLDHGGPDLLARRFAAMVRHSADLQRTDGIVRPVFRWHADGDVFSREYARAIRAAAAATPDVEQWIYTRTTWAVRDLVGVPNLHVLVSVDRFNLARAARVAARWGVPVAILADDDDERRRLWERVRRWDPSGRIPPAVICPASGKWQRDGHGPAHIVGADGRRSSLARGGQAVGACVACRLCLPSAPVSRSVVFLRHGSARNALRSVAAVRVAIRSAGAS
jgi:hypothetical protein